MSPVAEDPTPGWVVSPPDVLSLELEPAEPWLAPLEEPVELLPELEPARLVPEVEPDWPLPAVPDESGVWMDEPELADDPEEPDVPAL
jgi:hypothetical protein